MLFLCTSHTLVHVYTNLPLALLPILISEYNLSILVGSIVVALPRVISLVLSVPSGLLADRLSHAKLISFSLSLEVVGASLIMLYPTLEFVVLGFCLAALASTFYHPPALSATSNISPIHFLSRGLGLHAASGTLGISLGPITLGLLLKGFEWRYAYLIWIVPIFAVAIAAFFARMNEAHHVHADEMRAKNLTAPLKDVVSLAFLSFLLLMFFLGAAGGAISTYLTTYLTKSKGLDASLASIIFGLNPLIGLTSVIIGGYLGDKLGWRKSLTMTISTASVTLLCMFFSTSTAQTSLFYLAYGFFNIMTMPITTSVVARIVQEKSRGTAFSIQFIPESVVGIIMPITLGIAINLLDIWIIFPTAIAFYTIALTITQILKTDDGTR